jgi:hypothetical protein
MMILCTRMTLTLFGLRFASPSLHLIPFKIGDRIPVKEIHMHQDKDIWK